MGGDEPFATFLADELMIGEPGCMKAMVEAYNRVGGNVVCGLEVPDDETDKYGIIDPGARDGALGEVKGLVEQPKQGSAPSKIMIPGRYILQPEEMRIRETKEKGRSEEPTSELQSLMRN